ncbi:MAG: hypothetical protein NTV52_07885 [Acidobacteria bacterium]|nr:hypothetical protein [Acidobacteriota bacterium]
MQGPDEKLGDIRFLAVTQSKIALILARQGDLHSADRLIADKSIPDLERLGYRITLVMLRAHWAMIKRGLRQPAAAKALLETALADAELLGLPVASQIRNLLDP